MRKLTKKTLTFGIVASFLLLFSISANIVFGIRSNDYDISPVNINIEGSNVITADGFSEGVYVGTVDGRVVKLDEKNHIVWEKRIEGANNILQLVSIGDDTVIVSTDDRYVYRIESGTIANQYQLPVAANNIDYSDDYIYAIVNSGTANHALLYKFDYNLQLLATQRYRETLPIMGMSVKAEGDVIYVADAFFNLFMFDTAHSEGGMENFGVGKELALYLSDAPPLSLEYDKESDTLFLLTKFDLRCVKYAGEGGFEELFQPYPLSKMPKCITYDQKNKKIFLSLREFNDIYVIDAESGKLELSFASFFDINILDYSSERNQLLLRQNEQGKDKLIPYLYAYDCDDLMLINTFKTWKTVFTISLIVASVLFAILLFYIFVPSLSDKAISKIKEVALGIFKYRRIYYIIIPSMALLFLFCYYPIFSSLAYSFYDYRIGFPLRFIGFENFLEVFANPSFLLSVKNMFTFLLADLLKGLVPAFIYAQLIIGIRSEKTKYWIRMLLFLPAILPGAAGLLIWKNAILNQHGLLNDICELFGLNQYNWLTDKNVNIFALILIGFPFVGSYLIYYGALMNVPQSYYDSARLDGCGLLRRIFYIDIPFVSPQIKYLFVVGFIGSVQNVGLLMLTTDGAYGTLTPIYMMYNFINTNQYGLASSIAIMIFAFLAIIITMTLKIKTVEVDG